MGQDILQISIEGAIAALVMNRPEKRNAMCDELMRALEAFFTNPPKGVKVVILTGIAGHYCSGLDLSEHVHREPEENFYHSRHWHSVMEKIQFGGLAVVSAMFGAVIGGGWNWQQQRMYVLRNLLPFFNYLKGGVEFLWAVVQRPVWGAS